MSLPASPEDPILDLLGDLVSHNGLELWLLQADVWEEETLMVWVKLPHNSVPRTQREQVPLPDGVEGSLSSVCHGLVEIVAVACHPVCIGHEDYLTLPLGADGGNQLPLEGMNGWSA